jgi:hypothetical protein
MKYGLMILQLMKLQWKHKGIKIMTMFKERYSHEVPSILKFFGVTRVCESSIEFKWGYISFGSNWLEFQIDHSYEEGVPRLCFGLLWIAFRIEMPFIKQRYDDVNNSPRYGFHYHSDALWWYWGLENYLFNMPWSWDIYRDDVKNKDG